MGALRNEYTILVDKTERKEPFSLLQVDGKVVVMPMLLLLLLLLLLMMMMIGFFHQ
jgi:hypothetical protein